MDLLVLVLVIALAFVAKLYSDEKQRRKVTERWGPVDPVHGADGQIVGWEPKRSQQATEKPALTLEDVAPILNWIGLGLLAIFILNVCG